MCACENAGVLCRHASVSVYECMLMLVHTSTPDRESGAAVLHPLLRLPSNAPYQLQHLERTRTCHSFRPASCTGGGVSMTTVAKLPCCCTAFTTAAKFSLYSVNGTCCAEDGLWSSRGGGGLWQLEIAHPKKPCGNGNWQAGLHWAEGEGGVYLLCGPRVTSIQVARDLYSFS